MFGPDGGLVANAPHIPVHLGAMQEAVQFQVCVCVCVCMCGCGCVCMCVWMCVCFVCGYGYGKPHVCSHTSAAWLPGWKPT